MYLRYFLSALIILLVIPLALPGAVAQPLLYVKVYQATLSDNILFVKAVPPSSILILTSHGLLIYRNLRTGEEHRRNIGGRGVALLVRGDTVIVARSDGGVYELKLPTLEVKSMFSLVKNNDEVGLSLISVTPDLRYVAASLNIEYNDEIVNRLIVYDAAEGKRIFVRDPYSPDKLFKVFSVDFTGNYLIVEDIDELCELCELTDNLIEVYSVSADSVSKVSFLKTGLTLKIVKGNYILAQKVQEDPATHLYKTMLLTVPGLKEIGSVEIGKAKRLFMLGDTPFALAQDKEGGYRLYRFTKALKPASSMHLPLRVDVGYLNEDALVVYMLTSVKVYSPRGFKLLYTEDVKIPVPDYVPSLTDSVTGVSIARYDGKMYVALYALSSATLKVRVVSEQGPVAGAHVTVSTADGGVVAEAYTDKEGLALFTLKPGDYVVTASKSGFTVPPPITLFLDGDKEITVRLVKKTIPTYSVAIRVLGENGSPIPGALVEISVDNTEYSAVTGKNGVAEFRLPPGNYTAVIEAPGYAMLHTNLNVNTSSEYTFKLHHPLYRVRIAVEVAETSRANTTITLLTLNGNPIATLEPGKPANLTLRRGVYRLQATGDQCTVRPDMFIVNSNKNITARLICSAKATSRSIYDKVVTLLSAETLESKNLNLKLSLPTEDAPNGTPVDLSRLAQGKVLVIEFFYTKCTGCRYLLPTLKKLSQIKGVQVVSLTVSPADTEPVIETYAKRHGVTWPILRDTAGLYQQLNVTNYPTVAVYYDGKLVYIGIGSKREIEALTKKPGAVLHIISAARAVLGKDMERLPEILILAGLVLFFVSVSRGGSGAQQEDEGEDKGLLLSSNLGDIYSVDSSDGSDLDEDISLDDSW